MTPFLDFDASAADEMWLSVKIYKKDGVVLPEIEERKEIRHPGDFLADMEDRPQETRATTLVSLLQTKLETTRSLSAIGRGSA